MGSYVFKWPHPANDVQISGIWDDWEEKIQLDRVGGGWEKEIDLPSADEKVLYKFIVNGEWIVDNSAPKEGDGPYITNNVLLPHLIKRKPASAPVAETKDDIPGAFPETPADESNSFHAAPIPASSGASNPVSVPAGSALPEQKEISSNTIESGVTTSKEDYEKIGISAEPASKEATEYSVNPMPASSGIGNPVSVPAGSTLPAQKDVTSNTIGSAVTTSKEDYENAGSSAAFPGTKGDESAEFSVNPIPASSGIGNPVSLPAGASVPASKDITDNKIDSAVTTSKEDYEKVGGSADDTTAFSVNPIPASSGIGNPISLPAGAAIPDQKDITAHSVDSTVTTSKEDYEKAGSSAFPAFATAGAGALGGAALASAFSVPDDKKNIIPESSLPMGAPETDTLDAGPFMRSSGPGTTTAELASKVPLEKESFLETGGPDAETTKLATELEVPLKTGRSVSSSFPISPPSSSDPTIRSSGPGTTTADLASKVPLEGDSTTKSGGLATGTPDVASRALAESEYGAAAGASGATAGVIASKALEGTEPTIRSSGPGTTTADLASKVPLETDPTIRSSGPESTTASLAAGVPLEETTSPSVPEVVKESIESAHESPEAAASTEAVKEKSDVEKELLSKTPTSQATGDSADATSTASDAVGAAAAGVATAVGAAGAALGISKATDNTESSKAQADASTSASSYGTTTDPAAGSATGTEKSAGVLESAGVGVASAVGAAGAALGLSKAADHSDSAQSTSAVGSARGLMSTADSTSSNVPEATDTSSSVPDVVKESITSAHESPEAAASTEAVKEKSDVEKELLSKTPTAQATEGTTASTGATVGVPDIVQKSISTSHEPPEAAASTEAVKEKSEVEKELLSTTPATSAISQSKVAEDKSVLGAASAGVASALGAAGAALGISKATEKTESAETAKATSAAGTTGGADTASGVPEVVTESITSAHAAPEAAASPEAVKDKSDFEKELLAKTPVSSASGKPAEAATQQTSYYGLATSVPEPVEESLRQAHEAPEAAAEPSVVAEKALVERELLSKIPSTSEAGEPAPTIAAATSTTAPAPTSPSTTAAAAATSITDGKTANEPVPDTDTSSAARGPSAGELAGGAVVGTAAAAGTAALVERHHDADVEPPRVADSAKPDITTEASPAITTTTNSPGLSRSAAAAVSDGSSGAFSTDIPKSTAPVETTEGATTEYAPIRTGGFAPGVSSAAGAALSDGTEDPTLAEEPAVKMMNQNEGSTVAASEGASGSYVPSTVHDITTTTSTEAPTTSPIADASTGPASVPAAFPVSAADSTTTTTAEPSSKDLTTDSKAVEPTGHGISTTDDAGKQAAVVPVAAAIPSLTSAGAVAVPATQPSATGRKDVVDSGEHAGPSTPVKKVQQSSAAASPAHSTATSTTSNTTEKKKKRNRLSRLYHKIVD